MKELLETIEIIYNSINLIEEGKLKEMYASQEADFADEIQFLKDSISLAEAIEIAKQTGEIPAEFSEKAEYVFKTIKELIGAKLANTVSKPSHEDYVKLLSENSGFQTEPQQTTAREATEINKEPTKELPSFLRIKKNERNRFGKSYSGSKKAYISAPQKQC